MALGFTVLASGSKGNASLVRVDGAGILIDSGLGPRSLSRRLEAVGAECGSLRAVILTHTHGDHANDLTLRWMARHGIPLHCHPGHLDEAGHRPGFRELAGAGLIRTFDDRPFLVAPGLWAEPFELTHSGPTFGFRLEGREGRKGRPSRIGYLTDTGCWCDRVADALADVDLLGVEFNHDEQMQRCSGRSPALIWRNLGDRGHLSNAQGAGLLSAVLDRSAPGTLRHVVLLHLSDDCNRPALAVEVARDALMRSDRRATVLAASQAVPLDPLLVRPARRPRAAVPVGFPWES
ncbi:MBL fold metallo-hydrolase [Tautonia plasticadhaerens]|uniref:Metallo-hydrolase YycJ n=1 Tax=Tautonia plasticadhaerens TaxID=2527974 RepID=A0A518H8U6_9BACT|nr:MBL fold metallo-hydrolase [Tautonia plasticadhaerens]QDV37260.1 Putative metallo-hydrolase YycJ [Tautonia plasticadhaerens]